MSTQQHTPYYLRFTAALGLSALLAPVGALAQGGVIVDPEEEEEFGVPHVVIAGNSANEIEIEFDGVLPTPASQLSSLFPEFSNFFASPTPTLVVAVGATVDAAGNPAASGTGFNVPGTGVTTFEFLSNPVSALSSGFLNDDNGFESEDLPAGVNIQLDIANIGGTSSDPFFAALGSSLVTNIGDPVIGALSGTGFAIIEDEEVVDVITGDTISDFFALGDAFDTHPLFGLSLASAGAVGSALIEATVTDTTGILSGVETIRFVITNDPSAFVVPEPATAGLLALGGMTLALRRRRG